MCKINYVYLIRFCIYNLKDNNYLLKKTYLVLIKYIWYETKNIKIDKTIFPYFIMIKILYLIILYIKIKIKIIFFLNKLIY